MRSQEIKILLIRVHLALHGLIISLHLYILTTYQYADITIR